METYLVLSSLFPYNPRIIKIWYFFDHSFTVHPGLKIKGAALMWFFHTEHTALPFQSDAIGIDRLDKVLASAWFIPLDPVELYPFW